jgi:predicted Zn-dependent protease with MMP-like domain
VKISKREFDRMVKGAMARIPEEVREHLENIMISVLKRPSPDLIQERDLDPDEPPLGLYVGVPMADRDITSPPLYPDTIFLFQEPLEEMCASMEELEEEIEITLVHEIAHAVGISEERLAELGYD